MYSESNVTSHLAHVTKARNSIFLQIVKNTGVFHKFYGSSSWTFVLYHDLLAFSVAIALVLVCIRGHTHIWIACSHWSMFEFLVRDFPITSCTDHIACSILSYHTYTHQWRASWNMLLCEHDKGCVPTPIHTHTCTCTQVTLIRTCTHIKVAGK